MEIFGFWIFISVVWASDAWVFTKGYNTLFFKHRTPEELALRDAIIKKAQKESE